MDFLYSETGSKGNCSIISDGQTTIAIDCGLQLAKVNKAIGYNLSKIQAVLVTHSHLDHSKYIVDFLNRCVPCYTPPQCKEALDLNNYYAKETVAKKTFKIGTMAIVPFDLPHTNSDGEPCQNYGYLIYSTVTKEKVLWCTDCHYIPYNFTPCDYYCLECNYIECKDYSKELKYINVAVEQRRLRSHLSLENFVRFLKTQDLSKAKQIRLLHISESNGKIAEQMKDRVQKEFENIEVII